MKLLKIVLILFISMMLVSCGKKENSNSSSIPELSTYYALTEKSYASEARVQIKNLYQSASTFYTKNGRVPGDCYEEMEQSGDIEMKQSVIDAWDFQCDWIYDETEREISGSITASSTEQNDAGPGKVLVYDISTGEVTGYGQGTQE